MKKLLYVLAVLLSVVTLVSVVNFGMAHVPAVKAAATCTQTGFYRDNMNLTAAVINPTSTVTGSVNATGCNIGVYYDSTTSLTTGTISNASIYGANYFGVVNNGISVNVTKSRIYEIGEFPLNGDQHGVAIYFAYGSAAKGTISNNLIWDYQKGGIVVNGVKTKATISHNTVIGQGPINYIAQNGIQIGYGAKATLSNNLVTGNSYTGDNYASGGIIVVGGACYSDSLTIGTKITSNTVVENDVSIWLSNLDLDSNSMCVPPLTPTTIVVNKNIATNDYVYNTGGYGSGMGYQAGVADQGDYDQITNNTICGYGYTYNSTPPPYLYSIDVTATNNPTVTGNVSCSGTPVPSSSETGTSHLKHHLKVSVIK